MVISAGLPRFTGSWKSLLEQSPDPLDKVGHVLEAPRLLAVTVDGQRLAAMALVHEVRQHAAVVQSHPLAVGVEDADDLACQRRGTRWYAITIDSANRFASS